MDEFPTISRFVKLQVEDEYHTKIKSKVLRAKRQHLQRY